MTEKQTVTILTFGFSNGIPVFPEEEVRVFDCRQMPDPANALNGSTNGLSDAVQEWLMNNSNGHAEEMLNAALDVAMGGRKIAFGDGGGLYRSVAMACLLQRRLAEQNTDCVIKHRELAHEDIGYPNLVKKNAGTAYEHNDHGTGSDDEDADDDVFEDEDDDDEDDVMQVETDFHDAQANFMTEPCPRTAGEYLAKAQDYSVEDPHGDGLMSLRSAAADVSAWLKKIAHDQETSKKKGNPAQDVFEKVS